MTGSSAFSHVFILNCVLVQYLCLYITRLWFTVSQIERLNSRWVGLLFSKLWLHAWDDHSRDIPLYNITARSREDINKLKITKQQQLWSLSFWLTWITCTHAETSANLIWASTMPTMDKKIWKSIMCLLRLYLYRTFSNTGIQGNGKRWKEEQCKLWKRKKCCK